MMAKQTVLITGCSDGGLGSALAIAFHKAGYRVIATARNLNKLSETRKLGIEEIELDVLSQKSISACATKFEATTGGRLDILVNNAGAGYNCPVLDLDLEKTRSIFEVNVFAMIPVTRAFLPALMKSANPKIANNVSAAAYVGIPFQATYNASKAAANAMTETLRLELQPFGVQVIAIIAGLIQSNLLDSLKGDNHKATLPEDSIYRVVPGGLKMMQNPEEMFQGGMDAGIWADETVTALSKARPAYQLWNGPTSRMIRFGLHLPTGAMDSQLKKATKLDEVEKALKRG